MSEDNKNPNSGDDQNPQQDTPKSKSSKTIVLKDEDVSPTHSKDSDGNTKAKSSKTIVLKDEEATPTVEDYLDGNKKSSKKSDTEARTMASIKKLKVRPKTTTLGTATRRNLMSILGDTFGAITSSLMPDNEVNKTNFFTTIKDDDESSNNSEIIHDDNQENSASLNSIDSQFKVGDQIAEGGQGSIKRALDKLFHRIVAIKSLHDCVKNQESVRTSFINEARITAQLEHPSIVPIYGLYSDKTKGLHLAMKLIQGNDLRKFLDAVIEQYEQLPKYHIKLREHKMLRQRLELFLHVCDALEYVHSKNIIHRDLKPENIMIGKFNETYIMDWGIAEKCDDEGITPSQISGTPCYLPPELLNKQPIDKRSDIYLLGLILYDIVFLHKAYPQEKTPDILMAVRDGDYAPMTHEFGINVDSDLKAIIAKALEFYPEDRYQTVSELSEDIRNYLTDEAVTVTPHPFLSAIARQIRRHSQLCIAMFLLLVVLLFSVSAAALIRDMYQQMANEQLEARMTEIYSNGLKAASLFNKTFNDIGVKANIMAVEASIRLATCKEADPSLKFYDYKAGRNPETAPPGMVETLGYAHPVSFETLVYKKSYDTPDDDIERVLTAIMPMRGKFHETINSIQGIMGAAVTSIFIGQMNGLEISYPYSYDYNDDFDPRARPWFMQAIDKNEESPVWSDPYISKGEDPKLIITCSVPIKGTDGKNIGVLGVDVLPKNIIEMLDRTGISGLKSEKFIVSNDGMVLFDSLDKLSPKMVDGNLSMSKFNHSKLLKQMLALKNGRLFANQLKKEIFFFMYIEPLESLYVEKYDIDELKEQY